MTIKTINAKQITKISLEGITFADDDGSEGFIDFEVCYQNYLNKRLSAESLKSLQELNFISDEDMPKRIERIKGWKEVGRRNVLGNKDKHLALDPDSGKPYFVFYQVPPIAVECDTETDYWKFRHTYERLGWRTGDMT